MSIIVFWIYLLQLREKEAKLLQQWWHDKREDLQLELLILKEQKDYLEEKIWDVLEK